MFYKLALMSLLTLFVFQNTFPGWAFARRRKETIDGNRAIVWYSIYHDVTRSILMKLIKYKSGPKQGEYEGIHLDNVMIAADAKRYFDEDEKRYKDSKHDPERPEAYKMYLDWSLRCDCAPNQGCKWVAKA